ncbi:class C sortase [Lapidilactobacillus mulanensis]|uniref:Class C sortase n=1 Tax=Lapidilactobacillus mulanensis TaxID=2485999 RepID=A0ABW4DTR4_9LACO|nr:class C sortase [Lapidilactobacillus mulanensis]
MVKKKQQKSRKIVNIIMVIVFVAGICIALYPYISSAIRDYNDQRIVRQYQEKAKKENKAAADKILAKQKRENEKLAKEGNNPGVANYNESVESDKEKQQPQSYFDKHMLGSLTIPKIKVNLPVFDQTNDTLLNKGATLLDGTSYPTGGKNTHAVISAHRGLPSADMFDDLPKLKIGDQFFLEIGKKKLAYQIESTKIIEPTDTSDLVIKPNRDLVTLMTCTPYMINSHRLIYTAKRIPYPKSAKKQIETVQDGKTWLIFLWILGAAVLVGVIVLGYKKISQRKK